MNKYLFFILFLFPVHLFAQEADTLIMEEEPHYDILQELGTESHNGGQVILDSDTPIDNLLQWHLKEMRNKFEETFQDIPAYLKYFDPDFKIRVGNYRNRLECIPDLHRIRKIYPASYAVKTEISLDELKRIPMQDIVTGTETAE